jgi:isoleucyl-tRNA synthetase
VVGLGRAARGQSGVRTRQPLLRLLVRAPSDAARGALEAHQEQILEELNVKTIEFIARDASHVSYRIKPNLPRIGKQYGKQIPAIRAALEAADGADIASKAESGDDIVLSVDGGKIVLTGEDLLIETSSAEGFACAEDSGYLTELDTTLTDELIDEGVAREIVRSVQDARKQAGLQVSDRISLGVTGSDAVEKALRAHRDYVMTETLATEWAVDQSDALFTIERELGDENWRIELRKS